MGYSEVANPIFGITTNDSGAAAIQLSRYNDALHVDGLNKTAGDLERKSGLLRFFSSLKRKIEAKNDGKSETYDIADLHEKLLDFQEYFNEHLVAEGEEPLNFDLKEVYEKLQSQSGKDLDSLSRKIEDGLIKLKDETSDATNQIYLKSHLYMIVMNIFQELIRTDCRGKERLAQASRTH